MMRGRRLAPVRASAVSTRICLFMRPSRALIDDAGSALEQCRLFMAEVSDISLYGGGGVYLIGFNGGVTYSSAAIYVADGSGLLS